MALNYQKICNLHNKGWDENTHIHTSWGGLVSGYFNTREDLRLEYFMFLTSLLDTEQDGIDVQDHLEAIIQAMDLIKNEEEYGSYMEVFTGKVRVYDMSQEEFDNIGQI